MSDVTLRQLEYAVALADHGHFGRAADAANVSQPGLSTQIRELESKLGVTLFERGGRGVGLTPAGSDVVRAAREVLVRAGEVELAAAAHRGRPGGLLRMATIPTMAPYLLPTVVRSLRSQWPDGDLHLQERQTAGIVGVERGELDLGLIATPVETGSLEVADLCFEPFVLAIREGHRLATSAPAPVSVLEGLPVLLLGEGHCLQAHARAVCDLAGRTENLVFESASLSTLAQMVASGVGATLLPVSSVAVEARAGNGVAVRRFVRPVPGRTISLVWRRSDPRAGYFSAAAVVLAEAVGTLVAVGLAQV